MGPSHDQEIAWGSLTDFIEAAEALGIGPSDDLDLQQARSTLAHLALPQVAPDGRLREWPEDYQESEPGHRHLSHLWGMMPGNRTTLRGTPELAAAVKKSLDGRLASNYHAQVGDMMGAALAMIELVLQSHTDAIDLLPALPTKWDEGSVSGLRACGGFRVNMSWAGGNLQRAVISSELGGTTKIRYRDHVTHVSIPAGGAIQCTGSGRVGVYEGEG